MSIIREYLLNGRLLVTIVVTDDRLSKSLTAHYSATTTHLGPRDLFEYISKFEAKASNTAANNDNSISKLMKAVLSKRHTIRFADALEDAELDTKAAQCPTDDKCLPDDEWMGNVDNAQFWKTRETDWGKGPKLKGKASEIFKSMLGKL